MEIKSQEMDQEIQKNRMAVQTEKNTFNKRMVDLVDVMYRFMTNITTNFYELTTMVDQKVL